MSSTYDSPQVAALRNAVEKKFGHPLESHSDFSLLVSDIESVTHEHMAENTLRRIWGKITGYATVFDRTLDVLSRYCGMDHWKAFCLNLKNQSGVESDLVKNGNAITVEDLNVGDRIRMGWIPDRECIVEYRGGRTFEAVETKRVRPFQDIQDTAATHSCLHISSVYAWRL